MSDTKLEGDWQSTKIKSSERGRHMLITGLWSDCSFLVGENLPQKLIFGHKLILAMSSPVFERMFFGALAEKKDEKISIPDIHPETFDVLLRYIYTDELKIVSTTQACNVYYAANKYMLPHVKEVCMKFLTNRLKLTQDVCQIYEFAQLYDKDSLISSCVEVFRCNTTTILRNFENIEFETLMVIFTQDNLNITSEYELFDALQRYISVQKEIISFSSTLDSKDENEDKTSLSQEHPFSRHEMVTVALKKIRFLCMTLQEFAKGPALVNYLSEHEKFAILMNIISPNSEIPLPKIFSTSRVQRRRTNFELS